MTAIHKSDLNTMQLERQEVLPDQIDTILSTTYASISNLGSRIKDYRIRVAKNLNPDEPTVQSVKMEMFEVANALATIYDMDPAKQSSEKPQHHQHTHRKSKSKSSAQPVPETRPSDLKIEKQKEPVHPHEAVEGVVSGEGVNDHVPVVVNEIKSEVKSLNDPVLLDDPVQLMIRIDQYKTDIQTKIQSLPDKKDIKVLSVLLDSINELRDKANNLNNDKDNSEERREKIKSILTLIEQLITKSREFVFLSPEARAQSAQKFANDISFLIDQPSQAQLIDRHRDHVTRWLYESSGWGLFATDTRKKLNHLKLNAQTIVEGYGVKVK
jgi:hypothetical protein